VFKDNCFEGIVNDCVVVLYLTYVARCASSPLNAIRYVPTPIIPTTKET
jgi:hypothetical protein